MSSQEDEYRAMAEEAYQDALVLQTNIQNSMISSVESEIHIIKNKIDDKKEDFREFLDDSEFLDDLEGLYASLASLLNRRDTLRAYPYNAPITTNMSNRDPFSEALVSGMIDRLNQDL